MIIYKVLDETFVSRSDTTRQLIYREKYFIPNGIAHGYRRMGSLLVRCDDNDWVVKEMGYSDLEISKMPVVGNVEYKELMVAVAKVVLEHIERRKKYDSRGFAV